jgi:hypothetical protein
MRRTEQHCEFGGCLHEARCPLKVSSRVIEEDVVPHAGAARPACDPPQRPLQLHHHHDRQPRPVSLRQQVGRDDRLISLRRPVVGDKQMLVPDGDQRSGDRAANDDCRPLDCGWADRENRLVTKPGAIDMTGLGPWGR